MITLVSHRFLSTSSFCRQILLNSKTAFSDNEIREHVAYGTTKPVRLPDPFIFSYMHNVGHLLDSSYPKLAFSSTWQDTT